jgi:hypothetical protein
MSAKLRALGLLLCGLGCCVAAFSLPWSVGGIIPAFGPNNPPTQLVNLIGSNFLQTLSWVTTLIYVDLATTAATIAILCASLYMGTGSAKAFHALWVASTFTVLTCMAAAGAAIIFFLLSFTPPGLWGATYGSGLFIYTARVGCAFAAAGPLSIAAHCARLALLQPLPAAQAPPPQFASVAPAPPPIGRPHLHRHSAPAAGWEGDPAAPPLSRVKAAA